MSSKDTLGDRLKGYEALSTEPRAFRGQPLIARLDGKSFHTFTKGLERPFDADLSDIMIQTMCYLVHKFQADVGYTQSDEITLAWSVESGEASEYPFGGRFQKINSLAASACSVYFNKLIPLLGLEYERKSPIFDCRSFIVPNKLEAYHCFLWRQQDATKNAISMAAQSMYSHKVLQHKSSSEMQEMMWIKGVNFNDYPSFFKRGTFGKRVSRERMLTTTELLAIPEAHRPTGPVLRSKVESMDIWLAKEEDGVATLFRDEVIR